MVDLSEFEEKPEMLYQDEEEFGQGESKLPFINIDFTLSKTVEIIKILPIDFELNLSMS